MEINKIVKSSTLSTDELVNIKGGVNLQNISEPTRCTDCNCWWGNENDTTKPLKPTESK